MAVQRATLVHDSGAVVAYFICDTEAERPASGLSPGSLAYTKDTGKLWSATSPTVWSEITGGGAHPDLATHISLGLLEAAAHAAAADPHGVYQKEAEKGAASGYASLDSSTLVPVAQLGTGTPTGTKFLRDDRTFVVPSGSRGLPTTVVKPDEYTADTALVLDNCDATTNWATSGTSAGAPTTDTGVKTEGTASVKAGLNTFYPDNALYRNFSSPPALGDRTVLSLDIRWDKNAGGIFEGFELQISDQTDLASPHTTFKLGDLPEDTWVSVRVWVNSATIRSIGVKRNSDEVEGGVSSALTVFLDNIQMAATNTREVAFRAASGVVVLEEPAYVGAQSYLEVPVGKHLLDFEDGVEVRNKKDEVVRRILGIPLDGSADASIQLGWALNNLAAGETLRIPPGSECLLNTTPVIARNLDRNRVEWNDAMFFSTVRRNTNYFEFVGCQRSQFTPHKIRGYRSSLRNGSTLTSIATNVLNENQNSLESGVATGWTAGANTTLLVAAPSPADTFHGERSLYLRSAAAGDTSAVVTTRFQAEAAVSYTLTACFATAVSARSCRVEIEWYDSGGALISTSTGSSVTDSTTAWVLASLTATAPANTTEARPVLKVLATGAANEDHMVDKISFKRGTARTLTDSGTTTLLAQQGDEAAAPQVGTPARWAHYSRNKDDEIVVEFSLSDSAQVGGDCEITVYDSRDDKIMAREAFTLTASQTTYELRFKPVDLEAPMKLAVRKVTKTANTITVHTSTEYGRVEYDPSYEFASGVSVQRDCVNLVFDGMDVEGTGGYGVDIAPGGRWRSVRGIKLPGYWSRGNHTQGCNLAAGVEISVTDFTIIAPGRSGLDIEPYDENWRVERLTVRNGRISQCPNYAVAMANWQNIWYPWVENIRAYNCGVGLFIGGGHYAKIRDIELHLTDPGATTGTVDVTLMGHRMDVAGIGAASGLRIRGIATAVGYMDDNGAVVIPVSRGNRVRGLRPTRADRQINVRIDNKDAGTVEGFGGPIEGDIADPSTSSLFFGPANIPDDAVIEGMDFGPYRPWVGNSYPAPLYQNIWFGSQGLDMKDASLKKLLGLSGTSVRPNNLGQRAVSVTEAATTKTVAFPTKTYGQLNSGWMLTGVDDAAGTLTSSTTYYYRIAARPFDGGPGAALSEKSVALTAAQEAVDINTLGWADVANDFHIVGLTVWRGTTAGGPYTQRYDVIPSTRYPAIRSDSAKFRDYGSSLDYIYTDASKEHGYDGPWAVQAGSFTPANETGYEPDTNYSVFVSASWNTTWKVTAKRTDGFDLEFGTAAPVGATIDYWIVRLPT
jgi:hypothetical protein